MEIAVAEYDLKLCKHLAMELTRLVCANSISASRSWEEWELEKETIARYTVIGKLITELPIIGDLLNLLADTDACLFYCAPILKALLATVMINLESSADKKRMPPSEWLKQLDWLFLIMNKGSMLPDRLAMTYEVISRVSIHEAFVILFDIWCYFEANFPPVNVIDAYLDAAISGDLSRQPIITTDCGRFLEGCRIVLQRNIDRLGYLFPKMFADELAAMGDDEMQGK